MSFSKLQKLASQAFNLLNCPKSFSGFARACQLFNVEVYPRESGSGVIVRTSRFWVERFRGSDGVLHWNNFTR